MLSDNVRSTFDIISTSWDTKKKLIKFKDGISNRMEILLDDYVFDEHTILDIGSGTGKVYEMLRGKQKKCVVDMIDFSEKMCAIAMAKCYQDTDAKVYCTNLNDFKPCKKYDVITSLQVIHHMPSIRDFLLRSSKLMNYNGVMLIQTVGGGYLENIFGLKTKSHNLDDLGRFSKWELENEINNTELEIDSFYSDRFSFYFDSDIDIVKFIESIGTVHKINGEYHTIVLRKAKK
ncbi:bifunctional 3-demethylubiquinone-9 3-methyltransferase/ 2-octaprenyl-6-hydroxy phenol methylase [Klebsiella pneumoniae]|uniref:Bifunctional 3-demethylubiquinone-9 3-methyltransferase/ 2-octaprenyl-6-hydroxy phenol methylase n=2 Tax=Klebsiella pneumoniae TaxID=573 RepID=A0A377YR17_KLEPN|nr:bifunctional 3-demethylubiquinone-9 3-methyltransferase/ 2-octaprenyl-6-hydroxy phenol methylase [Klebsiella pneumoniae]